MDLVEDLKVSDAADDTFKHLHGIISAREESRRINNPHMRPTSELDIKKFFSEKDHITKSYWKLPVDFPTPICSGRFSPEEAGPC